MMPSPRSITATIGSTDQEFRRFNRRDRVLANDKQSRSSLLSRSRPRAEDAPNGIVPRRRVDVSFSGQQFF